MPEGDILRRAARTLNEALAGQVLTRAELRWPSAAGADLVGRTVTGNEAYGKHLFTRFDDGRSLHTHLRMEGSWRISRTGSRTAAARGTDVRAVLGTDTWTAVGHRLGMLDLVPTADERTLIGHLGPDVLAEDFPAVGLHEALARYGRHARTPVAEAMLDQTLAAGIGTLYAAESLYARRLWPWTPVEEVPDLPTLLMTARRLMDRSVRSRTPTATGDSALTAFVHDRAGRPCLRCGSTIQRGVARKPPTERPIFWCPRCQSRPGD